MTLHIALPGRSPNTDFKTMTSSPILDPVKKGMCVYNHITAEEHGPIENQKIFLMFLPFMPNKTLFKLHYNRIYPDTVCILILS